MSESIRNKKFVSVAGGYISENITQRFTDRTIDIFQDTDRLTELANNWSNGAKDKVQGRMFEQLEVVKFNFDALKKDSDLFAKTTDSMGLPHDKVDIVIKRGKETLREVQAKSYQTGNLSANALSKPQYDSMAKLLPVEQGAIVKSGVQWLIKRRSGQWYRLQCRP